MLRRHKRNANIGAGLGFLAILGALYLPADFGTTVAGLPLERLGLVAVGDVLFLWGCWSYAKSKGCAGAWGLIVPVGFALIAVCWFYTGESRAVFKWFGVAFSIAGLLVLVFLPDEHRWGK